MTTLAATLHDPNGRLLQALPATLAQFREYDAVCIAATAETEPSLRGILRDRCAQVVVGDARIGAARRAAVAAAVDAGHDAIVYCDFDRWLHWASRYPDELTTIPTRLARRRPAPWYVCLGRTARAFASHPLPQRVAEAATNRALSLLVGRRLDATAGACWLSFAGAQLILRDSVEPTNATDLEWPALIQRADPRRLGYLAVEGLEFETAAFHADGIATAGSEAAWIRATYERPEVWRDRLRLASDSVAAACRVLG